SDAERAHVVEREVAAVSVNLSTDVLQRAQPVPVGDQTVEAETHAPRRLRPDVRLLVRRERVFRRSSRVEPARGEEGSGESGDDYAREERVEDESRRAAADRRRERLEVCAEVADDEDEEGQEGRERGRGEGGEKERDGDEYQQLDVDERDRGPDLRDERPPAAAHVQERERDARAHHCDVDGERQAEAEIFS